MFWTFEILKTKEMSKLKENVQNMSIMCPNFGHFLDKLVKFFPNESLENEKYMLTTLKIYPHLATSRKDLATSS